ncbi:MAG: divalent-cation tolerance protein CutA [Planctomycetota bacterium]
MANAPPTGCVIVTTTTGDRAVADRIATELVDRQLAACVQVSGPIESTYRWEGRVERGSEWLCTAKTTAARFGEIERLVHDLHPYDVPELIVTPILDGSDAYLEWVRSQAANGL